MSGATNRGRDLGNRLILSLVFVSSGLLVFMVAGYLAVLPDGTRISTSVRTAIKIAVFATTLGATWHVYRSERWTPYRGVSLALFAGASGVLLSRFVSDWPVAWLNWPVDTPHGTAARKLSEAVPMVVPGLLLVYLSGGDYGRCYIQKGNLKRGVAMGALIGLIMFVPFAAMTGLNISLSKTFAVLPWIFVFAASNAFMEEFLIRGLFLREYEAFVGRRGSLLLTSTIFALFHLGATYMPAGQLVVLLVITFVLGLACGYTMQKSDSIWGAVLGHGIADTLLLVGHFASTQVASGTTT